MIGAGRTVLLTGWEGTLTHAIAWPQPPLPANLGAIVAPLVVEARDRLQSVSSQDEFGFGGSPVPLWQLLPALEQRIAAVYLMPVAMRRDNPAAPERMGADRLARALREDWIAGVRLFLLRLAADWEGLARWQGVPALASIASLTTSASDVHGSAGAVIQLRFVQGGTIFYKPRPLTGELLWAELNSALAEVDRESSVVAARVLAGGLADDGSPAGNAVPGYGWMEDLARGEGAEKAHWRRAGALLCLAHQIGLSDLHMANVVATADGPAVLDAECLGGVIASSLGVSDEPEDVQRGLLATGLLPDPARFYGVPDVSGLFGGASSAPGILLPCWTGSGPGDPELSFLAARLLDQGNRPPGTSEPLVYLPEILGGYLGAARALLSIRPALLSDGGWVDRLDAQHAPRVVLRSTLSYGTVLSGSLLPEQMASEELRREELRSELERTSSVCDIGAMPKVLDAEVAALQRLSVPFFHLARGTRNLVGRECGVVAYDAASYTPADAIRRRLEKLRLDEMEGPVAAALASILFRARRPAIEGSR